MTTIASPSMTADARRDRLASRAESLRSRSAQGTLERWLLIIGGVLIPLGIVLVVLGWRGASHTPLVFEQIPYLLSGGILGLGLVFAGGFTYFAYWQTVSIRDARAQQQVLADSLARIEGLLAAGAGAGFAAAPVVPGLVATATGTMIHRVDCPVVASREGLRQVSADAPGMTPCRICDPLS